MPSAVKVMRMEVRGLLDQGWSDEQIVGVFPKDTRGFLVSVVPRERQRELRKQLRDVTEFVQNGFDGKPSADPGRTLQKHQAAAWKLGRWMAYRRMRRPLRAERARGFLIRVDGKEWQAADEMFLTWRPYNGERITRMSYAVRPGANV